MLQFSRSGSLFEDHTIFRGYRILIVRRETLSKRVHCGRIAHQAIGQSSERTSSIRRLFKSRALRVLLSVCTLSEPVSRAPTACSPRQQKASSVSFRIILRQPIFASERSHKKVMKFTIKYHIAVRSFLSENSF